MAFLPPYSFQLLEKEGIQVHSFFSKTFEVRYVSEFRIF